jgi:hypothetical protein
MWMLAAINERGPVQHDAGGRDNTGLSYGHFV